MAWINITAAIAGNTSLALGQPPDQLSYQPFKPLVPPPPSHIQDIVSNLQKDLAHHLPWWFWLIVTIAILTPLGIFCFYKTPILSHIVKKPIPDKPLPVTYSTNNDQVHLPNIPDPIITQPTNTHWCATQVTASDLELAASAYGCDF